MKVTFKYVFLSVLTVLFCSCGDNQKQEVVDIPSDIYNGIKLRASKNFPADEILAKKYIDNQVKAYKTFSSYLPALPAEEYSKIIKLSREMVGDDYVALYSEVVEMVDKAISVKAKIASLPKDDAEFVKSFFDYSNAIDFKNQHERAEQWFMIFDDMNFISKRFSKDAFVALKKRIINNERNTPDNVMSQFYAQSRALERINTFSKHNVPKENMDKVLKLLQEKYPYDYIAQHEELLRFDFSPYYKKVVVETLNEEFVSHLKSAEQVFRNCVFIKQGNVDDVDVGVLVKINGKSVILCTAGFVPQRLPVFLGNANGQIKCSKILISEDFPLLVLIPDQEPVMFKPLEIASAEDFNNINKKNLYLFSPDKMGFLGETVQVVSETSQTYVFKATNTRIKVRKQAKHLIRKSYEKIDDITKTCDINKLSFVYDIDSNKLFAIGLNDFGNGDFVSFVKFHKKSTRENFLPEKSVYFVRPTELKKWNRLDLLRFVKQKNALKQYIDVNNEYLNFFLFGNFNDALNSFRIGKIARKYQNDVNSSQRLSQEVYERRYKDFMSDVLRSMRMDMNSLGGGSVSSNSIYSVFKDELKYVSSLRKSMYEYMEDYIQQNENVAKFIGNGIDVNNMGE